ncbi:GumC family protein [Pseudoroseicyclus sp. CXY001]|uniref:GumC family protein n=1 Tax=Pseudoroseicyclus sp. CXY001 TaxID=3242492 RepID=UPI0035716747
MVQMSSVAPQAAETQADDDLIDIGALLQTIWRGKIIVLACVLLAGVIGIWQAYLVAVPKYTASATVITEPNQSMVVDLESVVSGFGGTTSELTSEIEVIRARSLIGRVVERLELTEDPEFNPYIEVPEEDTVANRLDNGVAAVKLWVKSLFGIAPTDPQLAAVERTPGRVQDVVISNLLEDIEVTNAPTNSYVFKVTVTTTSPGKSALIADTIVDEYIQNQVAVKFEATERATTWLSNRVAELETELEAAEARVTQFNAENELVSPEAIAVLERQMQEMRSRLTDSGEQITTLEERLAALEGATPEEQAAITGDSQLTALAGRVGTDTRAADAFETRLDQLVARDRLALERARSQASSFETAEADIEADYLAQTRALTELQQLTRDAEASRLLYEYFLTRLKETAAQEGILQPDSRILSAAVVPSAPSAPNKKLIVAAAVLLGLMLGVAIVLIREMRANSFRTGSDLEAITGRTVLGQLPVFPSRKRRAILTYLHDKPNSAAAEAVRNLRTSIMFSNIDNPPQLIMVTSSLQGEGKTTTSIALAHNLAAMGKRVLLIEGDIRRRTLAQYFGDEGDRQTGGLVSVLTGDTPLEEAVIKSDLLGADVLPGEKTSSNAADVFSSERFRDFCERVRKVYDYIIIDTPPVLIVPDARIIAGNADAVVFAVRWDHTSRHQVRDALRLFETVGQQVTGTVLTQINPRGMRRYGYGANYGYGYGGYGNKYYTN